MQKTALFSSLLSSMLLGALASTAVLAQGVPDTDMFNGKWDVSIQSATGKPHKARLELANFAGTWFNTVPTKECKAKKFAITVQTSQAGALEFTAWGAQASPACQDLTVVLKPVSEKRLEGSLESGETVTLTRAR